MVICIDPGHGGRDPGAVGFVQEKDIVLAIAQRIRERLSLHERNSIITRERDQTLNLAGRERIARANNATCFVSIHCNSSPKLNTGTGFESFIIAGSPQSKQLQECIHKTLTPLFEEHGVRDRGQKVANFYVLRRAKMPAILLECLFVNNRQDANLLSDPVFLAQMSWDIADGINEYLLQLP